jgi:hypothetical protein
MALRLYYYRIVHDRVFVGYNDNRLLTTTFSLLLENNDEIYYLQVETRIPFPKSLEAWWHVSYGDVENELGYDHWKSL